MAAAAGGLRQSGIAILASLAFGGCGELPGDPEGTLADAREKQLRVGVIENPPWSFHGQGSPGGVEVELVEQLAKELDTDVAWIAGSESTLMPALERFELHLVVGGLTKGTPWSKRVGLSRVFYTNRFVVGVRPGQDLETAANEQIAVPKGQPVLEAAARERGAAVVVVPDLRTADIDVVAAPVWQLSHLGREATEIQLHSEKHVIAVPPGENGWLMHLDRFLQPVGDQVPDLLRKEDAAQ